MSLLSYKLDNRYRLPIKPRLFNETSYILWGNIILDWEWAINTLIFKEYEETKIL